MCNTLAAGKRFQKNVSEINLADHKIITTEDRLYSSAGAYSFLNLLVYLIEKYAGRQIAVLIAKAFMIDINKEQPVTFYNFRRIESAIRQTNKKGTAIY